LPHNSHRHISVETDGLSNNLKLGYVFQTEFSVSTTAVNALHRMCQVRECAVELRIPLAKSGSEFRGGRKAWCGIRVLGNGHNASIVRCLSSEWAIHGRG